MEDNPIFSKFYGPPSLFANKSQIIDNYHKSKQTLANSIDKNFFINTQKNESFIKSERLEERLLNFPQTNNTKEEILDIIKNNTQNNNLSKDNVYEGLSTDVYPKKSLDYYISKYGLNQTESKKKNNEPILQLINLDTEKKKTHSEDSIDNTKNELKAKKIHPLKISEKRKKINEFKQDIEFEIKRLNRSQKAYEVRELIDEMYDIKREILLNFKNQKEEAKRQNIDGMIDNIQKLKIDIDKKLTENQNTQTIQMNVLKNEFTNFKDFVNEKVNHLEQGHRQHLKGMRYIIEKTQPRKIQEQLKPLFNDPLDYLYYKDFLEEQKEVEIQINGEKRKEPEKTEKKLSLNKLKSNEKPLKKKFKLKLVILIVIAIFRIPILIKRKKFDNQIKAYTYFRTKFYDNFQDFRKYVNESMKNSYEKIIHSENFALLKTIGFSVKIKSEKDASKKINIFKGNFDFFIKNLEEMITTNDFTKFKEFLKFIVTNGSYIHPKFFTLFERQRLDFNGYFLSSIDDSKMIMILSIFILIKCILFDVFVENKSAKVSLQSSTTKSNIKFFLSIIYYEVLNLSQNIQTTNYFFKDEEKKLLINTQNKFKVQPNQVKIKDEELKLDLNFDYKLSDYLNQKLEKKNSKAEELIFNNQYQVSFLNLKDLIEKENSFLKTQNFQQMNSSIINRFVPDNINAGLEFIEDHLMKKDELETFYSTVSKIEGFDFKTKLFQILNSLIVQLKA